MVRHKLNKTLFKLVISLIMLLTCTVTSYANIQSEGNSAFIMSGESIEIHNKSKEYMTLEPVKWDDNFLIDIAQYNPNGEVEKVEKALNPDSGSHYGIAPGNRAIVSNKLDKEIYFKGKAWSTASGRLSYIDLDIEYTKTDKDALNVYTLQKGDVLLFKTDRSNNIGIDGKCKFNGLIRRNLSYTARSGRTIEVIAIEDNTIVYGGSEVFEPIIVRKAIDEM